MNKTTIKNNGRKSKLREMNEAKSLAKTLLQLDEDQFKLEGIKSLKIQKIISRVIDQVSSMEEDPNQIAYLIDVCQGSKLPKINQETDKSRLEIDKNLLKRKAVSPDSRGIYI